MQMNWRRLLDQANLAFNPSDLIDLEPSGLVGALAFEKFARWDCTVHYILLLNRDCTCSLLLAVCPVQVLWVLCELYEDETLCFTLSDWPANHLCHLCEAISRTSPSARPSPLSFVTVTIQRDSHENNRQTRLRRPSLFLLFEAAGLCNFVAM